MKRVLSKLGLPHWSPHGFGNVSEPSVVRVVPGARWGSRRERFQIGRPALVS